jgi:hypothetical protein
MSEICGPNEKEPCPAGSLVESPLLKEGQLPVPQQAQIGAETKPPTPTQNSSDNKPADPLSGTHEAESLISQSQKLLQADPTNIGSNHYQELLQKAIVAADRQFNLDKNSLQQHIQTDEQSLQRLDHGQFASFDKALTKWQNQPGDAQSHWSQINTQAVELQKKLIIENLSPSQRSDITQHLGQLTQEQIKLLPPMLKRQFNSVHADWEKANNLRTEMEAMRGNLAEERHESVMARAFLQESLRQHGQTTKADQLVHEAIFDIGGTPQEIALHADYLMINLEHQNVSATDALERARPIYFLAQDIADSTSHTALQRLTDENNQTNNSISQAEREHLMEVAISPITTRWSYGQAEYNTDPDNKQNAAVAKSTIEESQTKLEALDNLVNAVAPSYNGDMSAWTNPYESIAPQFNKLIDPYKKLAAGALAQIDQGSLEITSDGATAHSADLGYGQQMACDGLAFAVGYGSAAGVAILATPDTLGIGTAPAFLAGRAAGGSLAYNACRFAFGKPITLGSAAWGATDGLVGGMDAYFLRGGMEIGAVGMLKGTAPGALMYSSASAVSDYWNGADKYGIAKSFGSNFANSLFAPIMLGRPYRFALGVASIRLLASGSYPQSTDSNSQ